MWNSSKPTMTFEPKTLITKKPTILHYVKGHPLPYVNSPAYRLANTKRRLESTSNKYKDNECCICLDSLTMGKEHIYVTSCGHRFHRDCLKEAAAVSPTCALCRTPITVNGVKPPDAWYVKYEGKNGYRWLDKYLREKAIEREFEELLEIIEISNKLNCK